MFVREIKGCYCWREKINNWYNRILRDMKWNFTASCATSTCSQDCRPICVSHPRMHRALLRGTLLKMRRWTYRISKLICFHKHWPNLFRSTRKAIFLVHWIAFLTSPPAVGCERSSVRSDICGESHLQLVFCPISFRLWYYSLLFVSLFMLFFFAFTSIAGGPLNNCCFIFWGHHVLWLGRAGEKGKSVMDSTCIVNTLRLSHSLKQWCCIVFEICNECF